MKMVDIVKLSSEEIEKKIAEFKDELFNLNFAKNSGTLEKPHRIKELRHTIARCKTVLREREIKA